MSVPGRIHVTWQDDQTLRIETDAGQQVREFHFGPSTPSRGLPRTWQGESVAEWQLPRANPALLLQPVQRTRSMVAPLPKGGSLRVVTTNLRPGYLRKNGVPYSAETVLTEYWDQFKDASGVRWITIATQIADPVYLREPRLITLQFKNEPNGAKWDPTPCSSRW
jgi:hypothetical protein